MKNKSYSLQAALQKKKYLNNGLKLPNIGQKHKITNLESSASPKQDKYEEHHT